MHVSLAVLAAEWLAQGLLKQMVLVITEAGTTDVLERWTFDINTNKEVLSGKGWAKLQPGFQASDIAAHPVSVPWMPALDSGHCLTSLRRRFKPRSKQS